MRLKKSSILRKRQEAICISCFVAQAVADVILPGSCEYSAGLRTVVVNWTGHFETHPPNQSITPWGSKFGSIHGALGGIMLMGQMNWNGSRFQAGNFTTGKHDMKKSTTGTTGQAGVSCHTHHQLFCHFGFYTQKTWWWNTKDAKIFGWQSSPLICQSSHITILPEKPI